MTSQHLTHHMITTDQWQSFSSQDHLTWQKLFHRQTQLLDQRAVQEFKEGLDRLEIDADMIPRFDDMNSILSQATSFELIPVKGFIPPDLFFRLLADRKFPSTCFIRTPEQLDYLEEPDIFHDVFGHVPLLVNPIFADFMQVFGIKGLEAIDLGLLDLAATLYWFTVEFGLVTTQQGIRIYGAGILSSKAESIFSLESKRPTRAAFDISAVLATPYRTDIMQQHYFVIPSFKELFTTIEQLNWLNWSDKPLATSPSQTLEINI